MLRKPQRISTIYGVPYFEPGNRFHDQLRPRSRSPSLPQRSSAIANLMQELERRTEEAKWTRGRGAPRKPLLADDERHALAYIVMETEFRHRTPYSAAMRAVGHFSPGKGRRVTMIRKVEGTSGIRLEPVIVVGNELDRRMHSDRARTLLRKLGRLNSAEKEWCRLSARYLQFLLPRVVTESTHTLVATCRLAQLGWDRALPGYLHVHRVILRLIVASHPRRRR
jgi:hypothetical protein